MPDICTYNLTFAFNGTGFSGWQRQISGERTVQQCMEEILRRLFHDETLCLTGSSRTDSGVHALGMAASFRAKVRIPPDQLKSDLIRQLPHDIRLLTVEEKNISFNAHTGNFGKAYVYAVLCGSHPLFLRDCVWTWLKPVSQESLQEALDCLPGAHDFQNFTGVKGGVSGTVRTIYRVEMIFFGPVLCFYFSGNGFLHKMIRRIMGLLHEVATGKMSVEDFRSVIENPGTGIVEQVAPACGLYLKKVFCSPDEWKMDRLEVPPFLE